MARQNMNPQPWVKHMESYQNFNGGMNTVVDVSTMADNEVNDLTNMNISPRGSLSRRTGIVNHRRGAIWGDIKGMTWAQLNQ